MSFESRSAEVYENCGALAAARPTTPIKEGPCAPPLSPDSAVWQTLHRCRNRALPAAESAANVVEARQYARSSTEAPDHECFIREHP